MTGPKHTAVEWDSVEAEVLAALAPVIERQAKAATDRIYDDLLTTTQDYLAENLRWNIASRLGAAERGRRAEWERAEAAEKRAREFEDFTRRLARLITSAEWVANGRTLNPNEAVTAIDREIVKAREIIAKATGEAS